MGRTVTWSRETRPCFNPDSKRLFSGTASEKEDIWKPTYQNLPMRLSEGGNGTTTIPGLLSDHHHRAIAVRSRASTNTASGNRKGEQEKWRHLILRSYL